MGSILSDDLEFLEMLGTTLFLVVYDHREDPRFTADLEERFGTAAQRVGSDLLFRLQGE